MKGNSIPTADQAKVRVLVADDHPVVRLRQRLAKRDPLSKPLQIAQWGIGEAHATRSLCTDHS